jgi:CO dehydrogenase/acetyl-CoA synthase delta subunit
VSCLWTLRERVPQLVHQNFNDIMQNVCDWLQHCDKEFYYSDKTTGSMLTKVH